MNKQTVNRSIYILIILITFLACESGKDKDKPDYTQYVNPFIGASTNIGLTESNHGPGKTFPGATTPFGLVQLSPNTITGGDNGSGYSDEHTTIEGFAFTQMSGIGWYGDLGNLLVMPTTGELYTIAGKEDGSVKGYRSNYNKESETATAGYYSVYLSDYNVKVEATALPHSGILKFTYPRNEKSRVQIDLARRVGGTSTRQYIKVLDEYTIEGWMHCPPEGGGWGNGDGKANYTVFFHARFSKPLKDFGFWSADIPKDQTRKREEVTGSQYLDLVSKAAIIKGEKELEGDHIGFFTEFATEEGEEITFKAGISFVDSDGARNNYKSEIESKTFEQVKQESHELWNNELQRIKISGGTEEQKTVFYTALYHTMIDPRNYTDTDGRYIGGDYKIHSTNGNFTKRTIFSGWDVFRSQYPLQAVINPRLVDDQINSLITLAEESGNEYYERWEFLNAYSGCMIGNPAISVITDAYVKGIRNYDAKKALQYAINSSEKFGNGDKGYSTGWYSVSETLEYAYFDWCIAQLAKELGENDIYEKYMKKGQAYRNVYDQSVNWFRPRNADGSWVEWPETGRIKQDYGCIESNLYQQGWFVPQDIEGMVELMGGRDKVLADLTNFFDKAPDNLFWNDYYNHANEPVHFVPFLFNHLDAPWLTQKWTRHICTAYKNSVEGLVGNEDVGQMSAWYVLASIGLHPSCPGNTRYEITSPIFDEIVIRSDETYFKGKEFIIKAYNNSPENIYIQRTTLNGKEYNRSYLDFSDITNGGILEIHLGNTPNKEWAKSL